MIARFLLFSFLSAFASSATAQDKHILEHLRNYTPRKGKVKIHQSPLIDSMMVSQLQHASTHLVMDQEESYIMGAGYRIQIFSDNNQRAAKAEAEAKQLEILEVFPDMATYVYFQSPFWKLRVGNYRTSEEAHAALRMLKNAFPKWKEMYIINDIIKFPLAN